MERNASFLDNNVTLLCKTAVKHKAFTLAEMMVVLLIMSIIMAAMAPVITTRMSSSGKSSGDNSSPWGWVQDRKNIDAYLKGNSENQRAAIGQREIATDGTENARLILNTSDSITDHIIFKNDDTKLGSLKFAGSGIGLGLEVLESVTSGTNLLAIGNGGLKNNTTGSNNVAVGMNSLVKNTEGSYNSAFGVDALNSNKLGNYNTAVGYQALMHNDFDIIMKNSASRNVAVGYSALKKNTLGYSNVAIGAEALSGNGTGQSNIAIGDLALSSSNGNDNIAIGRKALSQNSSGQNNIAIGSEALAMLGKLGSGTLIDNIAIGGSVMNAIVTGEKNIAIGGSNITAAHNSLDSYPVANVAIGYGALRSLNNELRNVAIGVYAMPEPAGDNNVAIGYKACHGVSGSNKICIGSESGPVQISEASASDTTQRIYIGSLLEMHAGGVANFKNVTDITLNGVSYRNTSSDHRLKNVGKEYVSGIDKIRQIKPFNFTYKQDKSKTLHVGVIAQDLQKIFPNAVQKDDKGYLTIRQEDMFYAVINAIKELDAKITALIDKETAKDRKIKELEKRIELLEKKLK